MDPLTCPPFLLCIYCLFCLCIHQSSASPTQFSLDFSKTDDGDPCYNELRCEGSAQFANSRIELTRNDGSQSSIDSRGRVSYRTPVRLWNAATGEVASFNSSFTFQIVPDKNSRSKDGGYNTGDGMTFFLAHPQPPLSNLLANNSVGGNLGIFDDSNHFNATGDGRVVAVEFDTFRNRGWDKSPQHIGIDVNSIESVAWNDTRSYLTSGLQMAATVRYDNRTRFLTVSLQIYDTLFSVSALVDLTLSLPDTVVIGFSAATGAYVELHRVVSWSFSSTLENKGVMPPAEPLSDGLKPSTKILLSVLIPAAFVSVSAIVGLFLWVWQKKRRRHMDSESDEQNLEDVLEGGVAGPRRYLYRELAAATANFAEENLLGRGGFGSVYRGLLPSRADDGGQQVAIKKVSLGSSQGRKEFEAEVKIISRLRHRNLVQLLGWCDSLKGLLLVYELVPQGSLEKHIYNTQRVLTWTERYKIMLGLGSALHYLHHDCQQRVVHGDIKPSNIMLDSSYTTKLGDFGLARLVDHGTGPQTTAHVQGTIGYIDPEFVNTLRRSTQSDVYSFGIVLLEIVSGRHPVDRREPSFMLPKWVWSHYSRGYTLDAADARLRDDGDERQMERALVVGLWCAQHDSGQRPSVAQALHVLQSEDALLPALPPHMYKLPVPMNGGSAASGSSLSSDVNCSAITDVTELSGR